MVYLRPPNPGGGPPKPKGGGRPPYPGGGPPKPAGGPGGNAPNPPPNPPAGGPPPDSYADVIWSIILWALSWPRAFEGCDLAEKREGGYQKFIHA